MHERRRSVRNKCFLRGCVYSRTKSTSASCIVRNISPAGARIVFSAALNIPQDVELEIPDKMQTMRARVRWRRGDELGLDFCDAGVALDASIKVDDIGEYIARLERELLSLRQLFERVKE
jgi:hypothetical protein